MSDLRKYIETRLYSERKEADELLNLGKEAGLGKSGEALLKTNIKQASPQNLKLALKQLKNAKSKSKGKLTGHDIANVNSILKGEF